MEEEGGYEGGVLRRFIRQVGKLYTAFMRLLRGHWHAGYLKQPEINVRVLDEVVPSFEDDDQQIVVNGAGISEGDSDEEELHGILENINLHADENDAVEIDNDDGNAEETEEEQPAGNYEISQQGQVVLHHGDDDDVLPVVQVDQPEAPQYEPQGGNAGELLDGNLEEQLAVQEDVQPREHVPEPEAVSDHHPDEEVVMGEPNVDQPAGYEENQPGVELAVAVNNDAALPQMGIQQPAANLGLNIQAPALLLWEVPLNYNWRATLNDNLLHRADTRGFICEDVGVVDFHNPNWPTNWLPPHRFRNMFFKKGQFQVVITQQEAAFLCERPAGPGDSPLTVIRSNMEDDEHDANLNVGGTHPCNPFYRFVYFRGHGDTIIKALNRMSIDFENMYAEMTAQERQQSTPFRPPVHPLDNCPMIVSLHYNRTNEWVARNVVYCLRCFGFKHLPGGRTCGH